MISQARCGNLRVELNLKSPNKLPALCVNGNEERSAGCRNIKLAKYATKVAENRNREKTKKRKFQEKYYLQSKSLMLHPPLKSLMHNFITPSDHFPLDPQHITAYMVNCKTCTPGKYIGHRVSDQLYGDFITVNMYTIGGERNMKQRIPTNSITSKLVLKSMYASCSTGPFFADHYSHRFEKTQLKFRQEK